MQGILISGAYPSIDGNGHLTSKIIESQEEDLPKCCPFHADTTPESQHQNNSVGYNNLKYSIPTQEDESLRAALKSFRPTHKNFRTHDYSKSFNWSEISKIYQQKLGQFAHLPHNKPDLVWFAVAFRSRRRKDCDNLDLFMADKNAYEEAFYATNKSLLMYWYSDVDEENYCLATCVWTSADIARSVNSLPHHKEAARLSAGAYVHYNVEKWRIQWSPQDQEFSVSLW